MCLTFNICSIKYDGMLGVFPLGTFTSYGSDRGNLISLAQR
jgi:hypothetical protein